MRKPGDKFRVQWTEEEAMQYEAEGLVSVVEWDAKDEDAKPRKGAPAKAADAPVDSVLHKRVERLENTLSDVIRTVSELSLIRLTVEEVEAIRVALGTAADAVDKVDAVDEVDEVDRVEPAAVSASVRELIDREDEGVDIAAHLDGHKVDDLRAIANDMEIPNLHGKMTKATLAGLIVAGLDEQRRRYATRTAWEDAQDGAIVVDGEPVVGGGDNS